VCVSTFFMMNKLITNIKNKKQLLLANSVFNIDDKVAHKAWNKIKHKLPVFVFIKHNNYYYDNVDVLIEYSDDFKEHYDIIDITKIEKLNEIKKI